MNEKKMLCPFKKVIERDYDDHSGKETTYERFAFCDGMWCMAYVRSGGVCRRCFGSMPQIGRV